MKRKIVEIDEEKCNGCGLCIPNCPEGALQIIDNKARLVSDLFCDGLGACIGHCPENAITIKEREAEPYDENKVMENIVKQGKNTIKAHLEHLKEHGEEVYLKQAIKFLKDIKNQRFLESLGNSLEFSRDKNIEIPLEVEKMQHAYFGGCPGAMIREFKKEKDEKSSETKEQESELRQWPVQLNLLPPDAPFFNNSDLLISADCVAFANPNFHNKLLKGKSLAIGCPKLDDIEGYKEKIKAMIEMNDLNTITVSIMEVPCCYGLYSIVEEALEESGKRITLKKVVVGVDGKVD